MYTDDAIFLPATHDVVNGLANSVRSALRARSRQLEVKRYIQEKEEVAARQKLLIRELHHRVKNTLANVRAMMGATARSSDIREDFVSDFQPELCHLPTLIPCSLTTIGKRHRCRNC